MQAGTVLDGRYRLIEPVGAGGFGQVWRAHDPRVDRLVAVKVLTSDGSADHDRQVARFAREAAVAGGLDHPHIVTVHDFGSAVHHGRPYAYLVMQLLPGKSLSAALEAGRPPLPTALYTASCVADALGAAHEAGLTHRDIKPSNIMVLPDGEATVVDFGITKGSDARHDITTTGVLIGTPAYMAPEALSGSFDHRSDLYALGCVLFEAVTGRRPFTGTSWQLINQHLKEPPAPLRTLRPDAPVELERLVDRLLAKDPAQRPDSDEVYDLLEEINDRCFGDTSPIPSRGADVTSEVHLHPNEATDGAVVPMRMTAHENCPACATTGDETRVLDCAVCRGEGRVASKRRTFKVRIPAGVRNGQKIRLREFGAPGKHGGAPGDLYVTVHVTD
ncbi:protein kinase domain-containing protein [Streptomyces caniscabiei]|uniref:protein kinase domain-containing protein n=1 Tax=Streptomyces caniscabiei TaxID=2746961 RepID=UPI000D1AA53E|nr:protein kinase [Streptomyces caniscabiei]